MRLVLTILLFTSCAQAPTKEKVLERMPSDDFVEEQIYLMQEEGKADSTIKAINAKELKKYQREI